MRATAPSHAGQLIVPKDRRRRTWLHQDIPRVSVPTFEVIYRMPSSPETLFTTEFLQTLTDLRLERTWYAFVPAMLGNSSAMDAAARAVMYAHRLNHDEDRLLKLSRCDSNYLQAINSLRTSLTPSDATLVTVGLLCLYEAIMKQHARAYFSHAGGISAILLAQKSRIKSASTLARAVAYTNTHGTFQQPCIEGKASPFDDPYWLDMEPVAPMEGLSEATKVLRKLGNQLIIRVPGVIAAVRALREASEPSQSELQRTAGVANKLLDVKNDVAESTLLHNVSVRVTKEPFDKLLFPYSFVYKCTTFDKETLLLYWSSRLLVIKLCLVICRLHRTHLRSHEDRSGSDTSTTLQIDTGTSSSSSIPEGESLPFNSTSLLDTQERLVMNVLMTWQDGFAQANPLGIIWGALMGVETFRGKPVAEVRRWVWVKYHESMMGWNKTYSMAELDEGEDLYGGGPLRGWSVDVIEGRKGGE